MSPGAFRQIACDMLSRGYTVRFQAGGTSMVPTIADGETITVQPVDPSEVRLGCVVLCDLGSRFVAHRLVRKRPANTNGEDMYVFHVRGDAPGAGLDRIEGPRILGRIQSVEREGSSCEIRRTGPFRRARFVVLRRWGGRVLDSAISFLAST